MPVDRRRYLGSGDIAAVLGLDKRRTPFDCWTAKLSEDPPRALDPAKERFFRRRKRQEPVVAEMLADEGVLVSKLSYGGEPNRYADREYDWMRAEIDFEFPMTPAVRERFPRLALIPDGTVLNGEIKTSYWFLQRGWGDEAEEEVPVEYAAQVGYGMMIADRPACLLAVLFGVDTLLCYPILRGSIPETWMRAEAIKFWRLVIDRVPPEPRSVEDIRRLYERHRGKPVDLTPEAMGAVAAIMMLRAANATNESRILEREFAVLNHVRNAWGVPPAELILGAKAAREAAWKQAVAETPEEDAVLLWGGIPYATWKLQSSSHLDQAKFREELPELARKYTVESQHRVLRRVDVTRRKAK